jgi:hypothetical protein
MGNGLKEGILQEGLGQEKQNGQPAFRDVLCQAVNLYVSGIP